MADIYSGNDVEGRLQALAQWLGGQIQAAMQPFANNTRYGIPSGTSSPTSWYQPPAATPTTPPAQRPTAATPAAPTLRSFDVGWGDVRDVVVNSARNLFSGAAPTTPPAQRPTKAAPTAPSETPTGRTR